MGKSIKEKVAQNCSSFNPRVNMFESVLEPLNPSCDICRHFINQQCQLDLYDSIADNISMY